MSDLEKLFNIENVSERRKRRLDAAESITALANTLKDAETQIGPYVKDANAFIEFTPSGVESLQIVVDLLRELDLYNMLDENGDFK